jgi:hypothetical protein
MKCVVLADTQIKPRSALCLVLPDLNMQVVGQAAESKDFRPRYRVNRKPN